MKKIKLGVLERAELVRRATRPRRGLEVLRARAVLLLAKGSSWSAVMEQLGCSRGFVARWATRFRQHRVQGLNARHRGQQALKVSAALQARILRAASERDTSGDLRWSTRSLAGHLGVSHMTIHRVWIKHGKRQRLSE